MSAQEPHFERSGRVVCVRDVDGVRKLVSASGEIPAEWIENVTCFGTQYGNGDYLMLERRGVEQYRILGIIQHGSVLHEVYRIAFEHGLEFGFSEAVESEVSRWTESPVDFSDCEDLSRIPFVTVDGASTRDLDQALYVGTPDDGFYKAKPEAVLIAWYAIADASWFVRPGMALFDEALSRGASVYFAGMSVPMLPHALSQGIVSLNEDVDRRALVFVMQIDAAGKCIQTEIKRAKIHSRAKLVTEHVSAYLADPEHHPYYDRDFGQSLIRFKQLGLLRMAESRTRNVVQFNRVSLEVKLNRAKTGFVLGLDERLDVDLYNEQLSLLCNMEGARILNRLAEKDPEVLAIFRNHEAPSIHDVEDLALSIEAIVRAQHMDESWIWHRDRQSLADYFESLPVESRHGGGSTPSSLKMYRVRQAIERQALMVQRRSVFSPDAGVHSALGVNPYARFSAPMREIVGVFTHKEAIEAEFDVPVALEKSDNAVVRQQVIEASNRARNIQREVDKAIDSCAIAHVISHDYEVEVSRRPHRRGTILGMKASALYVRLDMPPIELKVYIKDMIEVTGCNWILNDEMTVLRREDDKLRYTVGDSIELMVYSFQADKGKWRVIPV